MRLSPPGTHFTDELTEAVRIKYIAQGHNMLMPEFKPSTSVSRNRHSNHMTNVLIMLRQKKETNILNLVLSSATERCLIFCSLLDISFTTTIPFDQQCISILQSPLFIYLTMFYIFTMLIFIICSSSCLF